MTNFCYMYHICLPEDRYDFSKGYIGISKRPSKRWTSGYAGSPHLQSAIKKYELIKYVFLFGTEKECLHKERLLRPRRNIGWNIAVGGGKPPSPKGTDNCVSKLPPEKRRKNYKPTPETIENMSKAQKRLSEKTSKRMKENNPAKGLKGKDRFGFKGYYITPLGTFDNRLAVAEIFNISTNSVTRRCVKGGVIKYSRFIPKEWKGKTWKELGWYFISKEDILCEQL